MANRESKREFELSKVCCLYGGFTNGAGAVFTTNLKKQGDANYLQFIPDVMIVKSITYGPDSAATNSPYAVYCATLDAYCGSFLTAAVGGPPPTSIVYTISQLDISVNCQGRSIENMTFEVKRVGANGLVTATDLADPLILLVEFVKFAEKKTLAEGSTFSASGLSDKISKKI